MTVPVDIVKFFYTALGRGAAAAALRLLSPDMEWSVVAGWAYKPTGRGPQAAVEGVLMPVLKGRRDYVLHESDLFAAGVRIVSTERDDRRPQVAVQTCADYGHAVNAFVFDTLGLMIAQLRGDHAMVHNKDSVFRKAYTVVMIGQIFGLDGTSEFVPLVAKYPYGTGTQLASAPNVVAFLGTVAIKRGSETVAGLGGGGSLGEGQIRGLCGCKCRRDRRLGEMSRFP
jgi:uncharacterized protein GlcG (DUF336 family)